MSDWKVGVIGASGYTGAELVRLLHGCPDMELTLATADRQAGQAWGDVFPHLALGGPLPALMDWHDINIHDFSCLDAVFCALPHGASCDVFRAFPKDTLQGGAKHSPVFIDLSADFRLTDPAVYKEWYGKDHMAPEALAHRVYGLSEFQRDGLREASVIACPGCYPTAVLLGLLPLAEAKAITPTDMIVHALSGTTGAGRTPKRSLHFSEIGEGVRPYAMGSHRHMPEMEQELGIGFGQDVRIAFTPHLMPMVRGELVTCSLRLADSCDYAGLRNVLEQRYAVEPFVHLLPEGLAPATEMVRGSNHVVMNVFPDRLPGRVIVVVAIDNLIKGSSGQALQNFNLRFGREETMGLGALPLFP